MLKEQEGERNLCWRRSKDKELISVGSHAGRRAVLALSLIAFMMVGSLVVQSITNFMV